MRGLLVRPHPASQHLPFSVPLTASAGSAPYRNPLDTSKTPVIEAGSATLAILCFCPAASTHPSYLRPANPIISRVFSNAFIHNQPDGSYKPDDTQAKTFDILMDYFDKHLKHAH